MSAIVLRRANRLARRFLLGRLPANPLAAIEAEEPPETASLETPGELLEIARATVRNDVTRALLRGLQTLATPDRQLFVMASVEQLGYRVVARVLGIPRSRVHLNHRLAVNALRESLPPAVREELHRFLQ